MAVSYVSVFEIKTIHKWTIIICKVRIFAHLVENRQANILTPACFFYNTLKKMDN